MMISAPERERVNRLCLSALEGAADEIDRLGVVEGDPHLAEVVFHAEEQEVVALLALGEAERAGGPGGGFFAGAVGDEDVAVEHAETHRRLDRHAAWLDRPD